MSARMAIRQDFAAALTGATDAGARVYPSRVIPTLERDLEAGAVLAIYALSETADERVTFPVTVWRELTVAVEIVVPDRGADPGEDAVDRIADQVEAAIAARAALQGRGDAPLAMTARLADTEIVFGREGRLRLWAARLSFTVEYHTGAAPGGVDPTGAGVSWDLAEPADSGGFGPAGDLEAVDDIPIGG